MNKTMINNVMKGGNDMKKVDLFNIKGEKINDVKLN